MRWSLLGLVVGLGGCFNQEEANILPHDALAYWPMGGSAQWTFQRGEAESTFSITRYEDANVTGAPGQLFSSAGTLGDADLAFVCDERDGQILLTHWSQGGQEEQPDAILLASGDRLGDRHTDGDIATTLVAVESCEDALEETTKECLRLKMDGGPLAGTLWLAPGVWLSRWAPADGSGPWVLTETNAAE